MSTLITGAGGFIGLNVVEQLLAKGECVIALSLGPLHPAAAAAFEALPGDLVVALGDVCDVPFLTATVAQHGIDRVLHTAAITAGPHSDPARASGVIDVNIAGTNAVLQAARDAGVRRVVLTSSSAVYGEAAFSSAPVNEDTVPTPQTLYAISKLASERLAVQYRAAYGLDVVRTRLTAIYGPWEHDTGVRDTLSPPLQIALAAIQGRPVVVADGGRRDWTSSADIARALVRLLEAPVTQHDLYNLGGGETWHPELLCRALQPLLPDWTWRRGAAGEAPSVAYNDALDRPRLSPPGSQRFNAEFGALFGDPAEGIDAYAQWIAAHGAAFVLGAK